MNWRQFLDNQWKRPYVLVPNTELIVRRKDDNAYSGIGRLYYELIDFLRRRTLIGLYKLDGRIMSNNQASGTWKSNP